MFRSADEIHDEEIVIWFSKLPIQERIQIMKEAYNEARVGK